ncbi:MAG: dinitrogenase iron-molybdenum cofactor biosynthesis protein [Lachnospiraceae bacterium]|nr:dinitrogenase iron-molybdenum cofactor biosynthesis protein [Lachnospiraceae bacterium]
MKIAVTYNKGSINKHLGITEQFKIYETDCDKILNNDIVEMEDINPDELIKFLESIEADVMICGNVGAAIQSMFDDSGILLCSGIEGNADEMVSKFLDGELI